MLRVIEHLINPDNAISEAYRVLKPGGFLIIATPNQASWVNHVLLLFGHPILGIDLSTKWRYTYPLGVTSTISGHVRLYTPKALVNLLEYYNFKVTTVRGYSQIWFKTKIKGFLKLVYFLDNILIRYKNLAANMLVLACKRK